jgi:hypothetical protein
MVLLNFHSIIIIIILKVQVLSFLHLNSLFQHSHFIKLILTLTTLVILSTIIILILFLFFLKILVHY